MKKIFTLTLIILLSLNMTSCILDDTDENEDDSILSSYDIDEDNDTDYFLSILDEESRTELTTTQKTITTTTPTTTTTTQPTTTTPKPTPPKYNNGEEIWIKGKVIDFVGQNMTIKDYDGFKWSVYCSNVQDISKLNSLTTEKDVKLTGTVTGILSVAFVSIDIDGNTYTPDNFLISEQVTNNDTESEDYVLNTHTMKFHRKSCPDIDMIKDENREDFNGTREEAIANGYNPCGRCNP